MPGKNLGGRGRIKATFANHRLALDKLRAARAEEINAEAAYDRAWDTAMLSPDREGNNKDERDASCELQAWKERTRWDNAKIARAAAEAELRMAAAHVKEMELMRDLLVNGIEPEDLFAVEE
jgi:antirestriction protein ArdC